MSKANPSRAGKQKQLKDPKGPKPSENKHSSLFEIVPGKFNENDWNNMLEIDDSQEFIWELIDEIFDNTIKIIYNDYIEKKTIPYTINEAKKAIIHIIDWQFINKETTQDLKEKWIQDKEPESCVIDSWAQGYVQSVVIENKEKQNYDEFKNETFGLMEELNKIVEEPRMKNSKLSHSMDLSLNIDNIEKPIDPLKKEDHFKNNILKSNIKHNYKKTCKIDALLLSKSQDELESIAKQPKQKVISNEKKKIDESIAKAPSACQSVLKTLLNRPPALREIEIDSFGKIESILKLDFDKIPGNNVKTKYSIVSDDKNGLLNEFKKSKTNIIDNTTQLEKTRNSSNDIDHEILLEPAPGVIFSLMNSTRAGPKKTNITSKQQIILEKSESFLKPIRSFERSSELEFSIKNILGEVNMKKTGKFPNKLKTIPPIS